MRFVPWGIGALMSVAACNAILDLGNYRPCESAECDASIEAASDAADAGNACTTSADCSPDKPVCSANACAGVISLSRGMSNFSCAVLSDHTARCWGQGDRAQLGDGTKNAWVATPVTVLDSKGAAPLQGILQIVTGLGYGCALMTDATVFCWGDDAASPGLLPSLVPVAAVKQISGAAGVNSGEGSVCAVHSGIASCWGFNTGTGRIGCTGWDGGNCAFVQPGVVSPLAPIQLDQNNNVAVGAGTRAVCALIGGGGGVDCFGTNPDGQMGNGTKDPGCCVTGNFLWGQPTDRIESSDFFTCLHDNVGEWACWGLSQGGAILGSAPGAQVTSPKLLGGSFADLSPGWYHSCAITNDGQQNVKCWGQNDHGQMGDNTVSTYSSSSTAHALSGVKQIASHRNFSCAVNGDGQVKCWGQNYNATLLGKGSPSFDVREPASVVWD